MADAEKKRRLTRRIAYGSWNVRRLGLARMSATGIVLETTRWALEGRFPELLHPGASGAPQWVGVLLTLDLLFFLGATFIAVDHVVYAISTRRWRNLNPVGVVLCLALWAEAGLANGYFGTLRLH